MVLVIITANFEVVKFRDKQDTFELIQSEKSSLNNFNCAGIFAFFFVFLLYSFIYLFVYCEPGTYDCRRSLHVI